MNRRQSLALLALATIWGGSFLLIKLAVAQPDAPGNFPPVTLVGIRTGLAGIVLYAVMTLRGLRFPWHRWRALALLGLINATLPFFLFSWGEQHINSNLAAIYNATTPLWSVILAWLIVREERLPGARNIGIALGFAGVVYLFSGSLSRDSGPDQLAVWGQAACLVAGICYAIGNMWARRRLRGVEPLPLAAGQLIFGTLWALPLIVGVERPWSISPTGTAVAALAILSLLGTAVAMLLLFWLLGQVGSTRTAQVTYLLPIFGLFWGRLIGEPITSRIVGSLLLILLGVVIVNGGLEWVLRRQGSGEQATGDQST